MKEKRQKDKRQKDKKTKRQKDKKTKRQKDKKTKRQKDKKTKRQKDKVRCEVTSFDASVSCTAQNIEGHRRIFLAFHTLGF